MRSHPHSTDLPAEISGHGSGIRGLSLAPHRQVEEGRAGSSAAEPRLTGQYRHTRKRDCMPTAMPWEACDGHRADLDSVRRIAPAGRRNCDSLSHVGFVMTNFAKIQIETTLEPFWRPFIGRRSR